MARLESRGASNVCFALAAGALVLSLSGNYLFGGRMAMTDEGMKWNGGASLYIDLAFTALCALCGFMLARKAYLIGALLGVFIVVFGAVSVYSLVGFQASERINKARTGQLAMDTKASAARERTQRAYGAYERNLSWLRAQVASARTRSERRDANAALASALKDAPMVETPNITTAMSDPQAVVFSELTGKSQDWIQIALVFVTAFLVVVGKGIFSMLGGYLRPVEEKAAIVVEQTPAEAEPEPKPAISLRRRLRSIAPTNVHIKSDVQERVATVVDDIQRRDISAFFFGAMQPAPNAPRIIAGDLYRGYAQWAKSRGLEVLTQNQFGRSCTALMESKSIPGLMRESTTQGSFYKGWEFVSSEAEEAPQVKAA
jgi:hypothetical protein